MSDETRHSPGLVQRGEEHESKVDIQQAEPPYHVIATARGAGRFGSWVPDQETMGGNARRLIACWNACAGIPTEALESGALGKFLALFDGTYTQEDVDAALRALGRTP